MKKILFIVLIVLLVAFGTTFYLVNRANKKAGVNENNDNQKIESMIKVNNPSTNEFVSSPILIKGEARGSWFFEASFPITLYDSNGKEIGKTIAQAKSDWMTEDFVPFEATLEFANPETENGVLIFVKDNPSGKPELSDELRVPVKFQKSLKKVQLYYYNQKQDKNISCSKDAILPVEREIPLTQTPIQDAVNLLLLGEVTKAEKEAGFSPIFPLEGVKLLGANLRDGILTLEFSDPLSKTGGGSCRVGLLWGQIEKTVKQFEGVREAKFIPEELFQP